MLSNGYGGFSNPKKQWLLQPRGPEPLVDVDKYLRVNTYVLFTILGDAVNYTTTPALAEYSDGLKRDCIEVLASINAVDTRGREGVRISEFRSAWFSNNLDWFHAQFQAIPAYAEMVSIIKRGDFEGFQGYHGCHLTLARRLGQIARLDFNRGLLVGDKALSRDNMISGLSALLPSIGDEVSVYTMCQTLCPAFGVTPARLETALLYLAQDYHDFPLEVAARNRREPGLSETVMRLSDIGLRFADVSSGVFEMATGDLGTRAFKKVN